MSMVADDFKLQTETCDGGVVLLRVGGYLDAHTYERLDQHILKLFSENHHRIVVDLSEVGYISSAGAGVFIAALNEAQEHKGTVVLLNPGSNVREVLDMLGFNQIFTIATDRNTALKAAAG